MQELNKQLEVERLRKVDGDAVLAEATPKARLIIVANRLPVTPRRSRDSGGWRFDRSSGGLVSAFLGVINMEISWVGWVGSDVPAEEREEVTKKLAAQTPFPCFPVYLDTDTADHFYNGFCNNVLWPLLHYIPLSMLDSQVRALDCAGRLLTDNRPLQRARPGLTMSGVSGGAPVEGVPKSKCGICGHGDGAADVRKRHGVGARLSPHAAAALPS